MIINFKRVHPDAVAPKYSHEYDGAADLTAIDSGIKGEDGDYVSYDTGVQVFIPKGFVGLLFPRSSISKYDLTLANAVGVLDHGYTNTVQFRFKRTNADRYKQYHKGDRIGQIMIVERPTITYIETDITPVTERGTKGYGSTGE